MEVKSDAGVVRYMVSFTKAAVGLILIGIGIATLVKGMKEIRLGIRELRGSQEPQGWFGTRIGR